MRKQALVRHGSCRWHDLGLPSLQNGDKYTSIVLGHPVRGLLLQQPERTNTGTTEAVLEFGHRWETEGGLVLIQSLGCDCLHAFPSRSYGSSGQDISQSLLQQLSIVACWEDST